MKHAFLLFSLLFVSVNAVQGDEFEPLIGFDEQLFPSFIISTATLKDTDEDQQDDADPDAPIVLGDRDGLLGISVTSPRKDASLVVKITCDEVMEPSTLTIKLPEKNVEYHVYPRIRYKFTKLAEVTQATPVSMTFEVRLGTSSSEQTRTVMLRPINDCPFLVEAGEELINTGFTFAAYVNEQHPFLDKLLREALDIGVVDSFTGYQQDESEVIRQVYSIWDALVTRDVRYSSITATSAAARSVASQHVRLVDETLNNSQANCVDGSVLIASALRKIGIEPFLVLKPGHCYVGFYVDAEKETLLAIETTMLGRSFDEDEEYETLDLLENAVDEDSRFDESWPSFASAIVAASNDLEADREKFASEDEPEYMIIDIQAAREQGILPIAFRGRSKFVGNGLNESSDSGDSDEE